MKHILVVTGTLVIFSFLVWGILNTSSHITFIKPELAQAINVIPKTVVIPKETTILFGGDVMLSRGIDDVMRKHHDFNYPFYQIRDVIAGADIAIVNLESPISLKGRDVGSIYSFRADPRAAFGLAFAGIDVVSLANNHAGDYGSEALTDTIRILRNMGIGVVGAGENMLMANAPLLINVNDITIALFSSTPIAPSWFTRKDSMPAIAHLNESVLTENISKAREQGADIVAVLLHWGNEYETTHLASQEAIAHNLIDAGATLVIGHHPHVVQEVEKYHGGVIAYSLGNLVFDQNFSEDTRHGLLLKVTLRGKNIANVEEIPIRFSNNYQPYMEYSAIYPIK